MFEHQRDYPTAITVDGAKEPSRAQLTAIRWTAERQKNVGGSILIYVPTKASLTQNDSALSRLSSAPGIHVGTWKGHVSWPGGPVIAAWPSREKLAEIADDPRTRALCVIPWVQDDVTAWQHAVHPELLAGAQTAELSPELDPVVQAGLRALTRMVNHANNLAGSLDHRDAVAVLRELHGAGFQLPASEVYAWALANGWPARGAERLREMTEKVDAGRRVQMKGPSPLRPDILDRWRNEAAGNTEKLS